MANVYGSWPLSVMQLGKQSVLNTAVAATLIWRSPFGGFDDDRTREEIEEDVGTFAYTSREVDTMLGAKIPIPSGVAHFEALPYLGEGSVGKVTATGAGPYVRDYSASLNDTAPALQPYTLRVGNKLVTPDVGLFEDAFPVEWELSGKQGETWKLSGTFSAPRWQSGSFTSGLALPDWTPMAFGLSKLYIDESGGTMGTTQKTGVLMAFSLKYESMLEWVPVGDGTLYAKNYKLGAPQITFSITYELQDNSGVSLVAVERGKYDTNTPRLIRIDCTRDASHKMVLDLVGRYSKVGPYNKEGNINTTVQFDGKAIYSATDSEFFGMAMTTPQATL